MHPRMAEIVDFLDRQRASLEATARVLPYERWSERPAPGAWSVAEVFDHLVRVESSISKLVHMLVKQGHVAALPPETSTSSVLGAIDGARLRNRARKIVAPPAAVPSPDVRAPEVHDALRATRERFKQTIAPLDGLALGELRQPHPVLGEIDLYQWLLFVGHHEARHEGQVREAVERLRV